MGLVNKQQLVVLFMLLISLDVFSATDRLMNYLQGTSISQGNVVSIADQQHMGIFQSSITQQVKASEIKAVLKYEESLLPLFGVSGNTITDNFELIVTYDIILTTAAYTTTTITGEQLVVNYDINSDNYVDIAFNRYQGYMEADLTITSISFKEGTTSISPAYIPNDVYLELHSEVERYYEPTTPGTWRVEHDVTSISTKNELLITWDYALGAENFELEWVFIDITASISNIQSSVMEYEWKDATRITTSNNYYSISMAYPSGMLVYRVRPVGVDLTYGNYDLTTPADWSYLPTTFTAAAAYTAGYGYAYGGLDVTKNWIYNVAYAEEGKRKEGISYFDGSARSRQGVTILNSDENAIVGETLYDFEGRPALNMMPTPIISSGIGFYENTSNTPFNDYDKSSFDMDANFSTGPLAISGSSITNDYYSSTSTSSSLFKDFIPDAEDYPFSRTTYKRDGTDRITEQTGVGYKLRHTTSATTKYYYGSPANMEIERLFGNEVGPAAFYQKNMVKDPNGQVSISYLDKEGRTIATALAGDVPEYLLEIDYKPDPVNITADLLSNNIYTANESKSMHVITIPQTTSVDFTYTLSPETVTFCDTTYSCTYTLDIRVVDENDVDQLSTPISYTGYYDSQNPSVQPSIPFTVTLNIGTYTIIKTLKIDDIDRQRYVTRFEGRIRENLLSQECVPYDPPTDVSCPTCEETCDEAFRQFSHYDETTEDSIFVYYDSEGNSINPSTQAPYEETHYDAFVLACKDQCDEPIGFSLCELKLEAMKLQMSPGGQYFDNLKEKYQDVNPADGLLDLDGNGEPMVNDGNSPSTFVYDIDGWLESTDGFNSTTAPTAIFGNNPSTSTAYTWDEIRTLWHQAPWATAVPNADWMDDFIVYHPEYCVYQYYCIDDVFTTTGTNDCASTIPNCSKSRADVMDFDFFMMSGGGLMNQKQDNKNITSANNYVDFLNPLGIANSYNNSGTIVADHTDYIMEVDNPGTSPDDPADTDFFMDPLFENATCEMNFIDYSGSCIMEVNNYPGTGKYTGANEWILEKLQYFLGIDGDQTANPPVAPTTYHSIWYVMDDPDNVAGQSSKPSGMSQEAFEFYNKMHGNSQIIPAVEGFFDKSNSSPNPSKVNKYQFFRGVYKFYRDYILYKLVKENSAENCSDTYLYWNDDVVDGSSNLVLTSYNSTRDQVIDDKFELIWSRNLIFDIFDWSNFSAMHTTTVGAATTTCGDDCENNANAWINQYADCIDAWVTAGGLTTTGSPSQKDQLIDELKADLIEICQLNCAVTPVPSTGIVGSSNGDGTTLFNALANGPSLSDYMSVGSMPTLSSNVANFDELIAYYDTYFGTTCTESVVYPIATPASLTASVADCNCSNFEEYITTTLSKSWPLSGNSGGDQTSILSSINALTSPTGTYVWADLVRWEKYCNNEIGDIIDFPAILECIDCKCENLAFFIDARFDDPNATPTPIDYDPYNLDVTQAGNVASLINSEFGTSYSSTNITDIMTACKDVVIDGDPNEIVNTDFTYLPELFRCNANLEITDPLEDCASELNTDNLFAYNNLWEQQLNTAINNFYTAYTDTCMKYIQTRETFTATYQLNEYMYTLYYYDQAGTLIKTVPPEGVKPHSTTDAAFYTAIKNHRIDPVTYPHKNVEHTLVTQYKYDSYNNLIWQSTPDGGETNHWYDKLGRQLLSQNAKQAAAGDVYSYTLYDELGRIYEVGEIDAATTIDDEIEDYSGAFLTWIAAGDRYQVTKTFYDEPINNDVNGYFTNGGQQELRTRVSSITREEVMDVDVSGDPIDDTYDYAIHFSYDIHGNVKEIFQENNHLHLNPPLNLKHITYEYDLVSGNVNKVNYQPGQADQYYHRYFYDADNRITHTQTSRDNFIWDTDAKYFYYEHGPLARTEIGEKQVAGSDYAYTLQGWIKGVNSNTLKATKDIGKDAELLGGLNDHFATDAYGYSLGYFIGDYEAIEKDFLASTSTDPINTPSAYDVAAPSLYNGNIRQMVTVLLNEDEKRQTVHGTAYRYDQANRIKKSNVFTGVVNNSFEDATDNNYYKTTHNYDLNGNITQLNRYNDAGVWMDSLNYQYKNDGNGLYQSNGGAFTPGYDYRDGTFTGAPSVSNANKNQLTRVLDGKGVVNTTDFGTGGMLPQDFEYDEIGQLTKDLDEHIDTILWDVYGKVKEIRYYDASNLTRPDILFRYDPSGNRIAKILKTKEADGSIKTANHWEYYYYVRDAQGNIMAVYQQDITHLSGNEYQSTLTLLERNIYGSSRLGVDNQQVVSISKFFATFTTSGGTTTTGTANYPTSSVVEVSGGGNITITDPSMEDLHLTIQALDNDVTLFAQNINVISGSLSYSPEGMLMLPAHQQAEITCGYELELMNGGTPVNIQPMNSNTLTYTAANTINITPLFNFNKKQRTIGKKVYEKSNHLGNVLVTLSDRKFPVKVGTTWDYYDPNVLSYSDYYPFGSLLPGRNSGSESYRYGYNKGSEKDDEITGVTGSHFTTYFREFDTRLLIPWSPDPVIQPWQSPYSYMDGNPIIYNDPFGDTKNYYNADGTHKETTHNNWFHNTFFGNQNYIENTVGGYSKVSDDIFNDWQSDIFPTAYVDEEARREALDAYVADFTYVRDLEKMGMEVEYTDDRFKALGSYLQFTLPSAKLPIKTPSSTTTTTTNTTTKLLGTQRDRLLRTVENPQLKKMIEYLWRSGAKHGTGSTGSMIRLEKAEGIMTSASGSHIEKAEGALVNLKKLLNGNYGALSESDRKIVFEIIEDLTSGTGVKY